jgi:hypothetical protein
MIRFLQQDNKLTKIIFGVIIGVVYVWNGGLPDPGFDGQCHGERYGRLCDGAYAGRDGAALRRERPGEDGPM